MSLPLSPAGVAGAYARVQAGPKDLGAAAGILAVEAYHSAISPAC